MSRGLQTWLGTRQRQLGFCFENKNEKVRGVAGLGQIRKERGLLCAFAMMKGLTDMFRKGGYCAFHCLPVKNNLSTPPHSSKRRSPTC